MIVRMVLPALAEASDPGFRPIKYALFPPLGLATLAGYLRADDDVSIMDEHVRHFDHGGRPDLVLIQCYTTSTARSYRLGDMYKSRGSYVVLGGLHPSALPQEAAQHADTVFIGPGDHTFAQFISDFRSGEPRRVYYGRHRWLQGVPAPRRELIKRRSYLVPNTIVVSRGCPHHCDFCYKDTFYRGGRSFYTARVDSALAEIDSLPGRHLFFLDDQLFGNERFVRELFSGMRGMGRVWQAAGTVRSVLRPGLMDLAAEVGLRSLFIGFESITQASLEASGKHHNRIHEYHDAIERLHSLGIMINGSFVFGFDQDDLSVFDRTVDWAIDRGIETATFHILTPYPGTPLRQRLNQEGRLLAKRWELHDTRHAVFTPKRMEPRELEAGYRRSYRRFYSWGSIHRCASNHPSLLAYARHMAYAGGWKKFEPVWDWVIRAGRVTRFLPLLETVLSGFGSLPSQREKIPVSLNLDEVRMK